MADRARTFAPPWSGLTLTDVRMAPGLVLRTHGHERAHVCLVVDGAFLDRSTPRAARECGAGALRFSAPARRHELEFGPQGARCVLVELDARRYRSPSGSDVFRDHPALAHLVQRLCDLCHAPPGTAALDLETATLELLAGAALGEPDHSATWLAEAHALVESAALERASVSAIARRAGVHRSHLARAYTQRYGRSPSAHVAALRMRRAVHLLTATAAPLCDVALAAGYCDQAHLTRALATKLGVTPAALRRRCAEPPVS